MQTLESGVGDVDVRSIRQTIGSTASVGFHPTRRAGLLSNSDILRQHDRHHSSRVAMMPHAGLAAAAPRVATTRAPRGGARDTRARSCARGTFKVRLLNGTAN